MYVQLRVMVNSASLLTTLLFALGNLLGQNLGNHDANWTQYYGVFLAVSQPLAKLLSCFGFLYEGLHLPASCISDEQMAFWLVPSTGQSRPQY